MNPTKHIIQDGINDYPQALFHSIFLTSLMNQQVFKRDILMQFIRERLVTFRELKEKQNAEEENKNLDNDEELGETDIKIRKDEKKWNLEIIEYLKKW